MTEYIIDWGGIGARLVELYEEGVPPFLWTKRLREERLRERVVRCRDCRHYTDNDMEYCRYCGSWCEQVEPDGFCWKAKRKEDGDDR